jgi:hypothetical protein
MAELQFDDAAATGYDSLTGPVSKHIGAGMRVLDVVGRALAVTDLAIKAYERRILQ